MLVIMLEQFAGRNAALISLDQDRRAMRIRAADHQHMVAFETMVAGKDIGGQIHTRQMSNMQVTIGVGPGNRNVNVLCHEKSSPILSHFNRQVLRKTTRNKNTAKQKPPGM